MKNKIKILGLFAAGAMALTGCADDFLEQENTTSLNMATFFDSDESVSMATATLYNYVWNSFNGKLYYSMGDGRANNITAQWSNYIKYFTNFNDDGTTEGLYDGWSALYSVVAQSNNVINNIEKYATSSISETAKNAAIAEARFMRGTAYWYLASLWGNVVLYENTGNLVNSYVVAPHNQADVFEFAIRDLEFAVKNLPAASSAPGRVNKYSAAGMLSRVYLSMAGITTDGQYDGSNAKGSSLGSGSRNTYYLDLAKKAAQYVIEKGPFKLMDNYGDLFTIANNNCAEDIFQLQWIAGSTGSIGWGCNQDITAFFGWSTMVSDETNWGGATCCSWDLYAEFHRLDTEDGIFTYKTQFPGEAGKDLRMKECIAEYDNFYPEMNVKNGGYTYGVTESASTNGANIKKYVVGTHDDNGVSYKQSSAIR
ncbi:MAG: RagB/SusD family nutrient uptake outer membrane protein, partial [Bacteroidales bacterium]|nr:RagB/SusD family nutrient uptake outer membrane protein [Bacteroidales bacterium]